MAFIARLQPLEDMEGVINCRFLDVNLLEPPGEGTVFFYLIFVFLIGGGSDAA